ncbi:MAG: hypothetical protein AAFX87_12375 [Bacteroidota bacterium]
MRHNQLLFLFFLFFNLPFSFAQKTIGEINLPLKDRLRWNTAMIPIHNQNGRDMALAIVEEEQIYFTVVNEWFEVTDTLWSVERPKQTIYSDVLGGLHGPKGLYHLFFKSTDKIRTVSIDVDDRSVEYHDRLFPGAGEKYITSFIDSNSDFYLLTAGNKKNTLNVYKSKNGIEYEKTAFEVNGLTRRGELINFGSFFRRRGLHYIPQDRMIDLVSGYRKNKLYLQDDMMYISIDTENEYTILLKLDMNDHSTSYKYFKQHKSSCMSDITSYVDAENRLESNSFLHKQLLYQTMTCSNAFQLSIVDIDTKEVLNQFSFDITENIPFKNSHIYFESGGSFYTLRQERARRMRRHLLQGMTKETPAIVVNESGQDTLQLTIGSYGDFNQDCADPSIYPFTARRPFGRFTSSSFYGAYPGFTGAEDDQSVYFRTVIDAKTLKAIELPLKGSTFSVIRDFNDDNYLLSKRFRALTVFNKEDQLILGYYNIREQKYILKLFF